MSVYANFASVKSIKAHNVDEVRYQTIGRGHGFSELEGVPFNLSEKFYFKPSLNSSLYKLNDIQLEYSRVVDSTCTYSFDLEKKVLANMTNSYNKR